MERSEITPSNGTALGSRPSTAELEAARDEEFRLVEEAEKEEWNREQKQIEEDFLWEGKSTAIPLEYQENYKQLLSQFGSKKKIDVLKMLDNLKWEKRRCFQVYTVLLLVPHEKIEDILYILTYFSVDSQDDALSRALDFLMRLQHKSMHELLYNISLSELNRLLEVARFIDPHEYDLMIDLIHQLSIQEVLKWLTETNEPMAKHCRLCRVRRMNELETRLLNEGTSKPGEQIPKAMLRVSGCLPIYSKAQVWSAQDEKMFRFDVEKGKIYFRKELVDLVRICEKCLQDVHECAANDTNRYDPLHSIDAKERKEVYASLRAQEQLHAELICKITFERINRRCREWSLRALETQRHGHRLEQDERDRIEAQRVQKESQEKLRLESEEIVRKALTIDTKILAEDRRKDLIRLAVQQDNAALQLHLPYDEANPVPNTREHPHSWLRIPYDETGLPISPDAAAKRFGLNTRSPDIRFKELNQWKEETIARHNAYLKDEEEIAKKKRSIALDEFNQTVSYVDMRIKRIDRVHQLDNREAETAERIRLERRAADRRARRALREAGYEASERSLMAIDDEHAHKRRFYVWEQEQIFRERTDMFEEELDQTEEDRFWGIDNWNYAQRLELERKAALYSAEVERMRVLLVKSKIIKPELQEVKDKVYRDRLTGKVLS